MSALAAAVAELIRAGVSGDELIAAVERLEVSIYPPRSAGAVRQERYRRNKAQQAVTSVTKRNEVTLEADQSVTSVTKRNEVTLQPVPSPPSPKDSADNLLPIHRDQNLIPPIPHKENPPTGGKRKSLPSPLPDDFDVFWQAWPDKRDKGHARKAYLSARKRADAETILAGVANVSQTRAWCDGFRVLAATWLNGDRWLDEPETVARAPPVTAGMLAAASDELAFRMAIERAHERENGNTGGNQGVVVALPASAARPEGPGALAGGLR